MRMLDAQCLKENIERGANNPSARRFEQAVYDAMV